MAEKKPDNLKRYRFSVPKNDDPVIHWLSVQANVSYSLRTLIRDSISRQGYVDITCGEPSAKSPGRPKKLQQDAIDRAAAGHLYDEPVEQVNAGGSSYEPVPPPQVPQVPPVQEPVVMPGRPAPQTGSYSDGLDEPDDDGDDMAMFSFRRK